MKVTHVKTRIIRTPADNPLVVGIPVGNATREFVTVELGTDGWIQNIEGAILTPGQATWLFIFTSALMFALRFCANFIEKNVGLSPVGLLMTYLNWPRPPLIFGLVLGRIVENNLFISYSRYELGFLTRPLVMVIIVLAIGLVIAPILQDRFARRLGVKEELILADEG